MNIRRIRMSAARSKKRKQGRPQRDMPAVGREALIAATRKLVRTMSPGQITRLDIARAAGVDPALIRYYFGNKEALMSAAVLEAGAEMRDRLRRDSAQGTTAGEKLARRMAALMHMLYEDPSLHRLIIERVIHNYSRQARNFRNDLVYGAVDQLAAIIDAGVASGELKRVDPRHLFLAMIGVCSFPMGERALFDELMGKDASPNDLDSYARFVTGLFINGLAIDGRQKNGRAKTALLARTD